MYVSAFQFLAERDNTALHIITKPGLATSTGNNCPDEADDAARNNKRKPFNGLSGTTLYRKVLV
jgi:hypothetical protein